MQGNISGGGFLHMRTASGEVGSLDYREKAPLNAYVKMYLDEMVSTLFLKKVH